MQLASDAPSYPQEAVLQELIIYSFRLDAIQIGLFNGMAQTCYITGLASGSLLGDVTENKGISKFIS